MPHPLTCLLYTSGRRVVEVEGGVRPQQGLEPLRQGVGGQGAGGDDHLPLSLIHISSFEDDLGADSVDLVELVMAMEEEFELGQTAEDEVKRCV